MFSTYKIKNIPAPSQKYFKISPKYTQKNKNKYIKNAFTSTQKRFHNKLKKRNLHPPPFPYKHFHIKKKKELPAPPLPKSFNIAPNYLRKEKQKSPSKYIRNVILKMYAKICQMQQKKEQKKITIY